MVFLFSVNNLFILFIFLEYVVARLIGIITVLYLFSVIVNKDRFILEFSGNVIREFEQ